MKRIIKAGLVVLLGASIWTNGGVIKEAKAQVCGDGGQYTFHHTPQGVMTPICVGGSSGNRVYGTHPDDGRGPQQSQQSTNQRPAIKKSSSYGAVAWGSGSSYGSSANQTSKQNAINTALQKCSSGGDTCKIQVTYSNQCVAQTYGVKPDGSYWWRISYGSTQKKATQAALKDCSKTAKNCQVSFSECSLP